MEISQGVTFESLVGQHNQARRLTTGLVTFLPAAVLPYHTHSFAESITLLRGAARVDVEGRCYTLARLDNVVIPAGHAHMAASAATETPAVLHIAMATDSPSRTLIGRSFDRRPMPDDATGIFGAERVNRFLTAPRSAAGPGTEFIDCFNEDLMPRMDMSGGYGLFFPGGRLPAHVHDFDESICIISGDATCVVEGRRYTMGDCATALQPRGRVHYFINESTGPMEMIWVYAGPRPERILVDEACATPDGNPWP
jgi:quercetin dioxygenase-like cupin family protein